MPKTSRRKWGLSVAGIGLALAGLLTASLVAPSQSMLGPQVAEAKTKPHAATHRKGIAVGSQWVGTWNVWTKDGNKPGVCFQPKSGHPTSTGAYTEKGKIPGMSAKQSADVKYATNKYGNTASNTTAAGLNLYVWKVQDEPSFRGGLHSLLHNKKLKGAVAAMNAIAKEASNHGPYKATGSVQSGQYGKTVNGSFTFKNSSGKPATGKRITLAGSGLTPNRSAVTTNSRGVAAFSGKVSTIGTYTVKGTLTGPTPATVLINKPSKGHQKTVIYTPGTESRVVTTGNHGNTSGAKIAAQCGENCHGQAPVTVTKKNECGGYPQRVFTVVNGSVKFTFDVAPCATVTKSFTGNDTDKVLAQVCYLDHVGGLCKTGRITVGSYTVVCPPWPKVSITTVCDCDKATTSVTFYGPAGARGYKGYVNINGKVTTVAIANGRETTLSLGTIAGTTTIKTSFAAYSDGHFTKQLKSAPLGRTVTIG